MTLTPQQRQALRRQCSTIVPGFKALSPAEEFKALAAWCASREEAGNEADVYGEAGLVGAFETQIATLLGKQAAVFMPSGVMAQLIAVRLHTQAARLPRFGLSPNSHLMVHEQEAATALFGLHPVPIGSRLRPILADDLAAAARQPLACALIELPMREIGGQLPTWEQLEALKAQAASSGITLHMDGARLWQCQAFYGGRSFAEIAAGFGSVYVSLYKDIGGMAGALLAGDAAFIAEARLWQRRMGGNLYQQTALAASALMRFEQRLALMDDCHRRTLQLAQGLAALPGLRVNPAVPQANMLHLHFDAPAEALNQARDALAQAQSCWLFGAARASEVPGWSQAEISVGDQLLAIDNASLLPLFEQVLAQARYIAAQGA